MEDSKRTVIVLLSMHRCGSSLTTSILERLGMSLGPFELNGAAPSNPHGHFEAVPFLDLNRRVQNLALGFPDDLPDSPAVLSRLLETEGTWPDGIQIPEELLDQGRSLIEALIESGEVSGFKDPRTVLTWPFWERVFAGFPDVRIALVSLLRSPHEIAMSLVTRRQGWYSYWTALDVVSVHLRRQKAIVESRGQPLPGLCFGSPAFLETLVDVIQRCGLQWNTNKALEVFDKSCVHHVPAVVPHEAQEVFASLCHPLAAGGDDDSNRAQIVADARFLEALRLQQWQTLSQKLGELNEHARSAHAQAEEFARQLRESEARLLENRLQAIENQQRLIESQHELSESQRRLASSHQVQHQIQEKLIESQVRELQLRELNEALRTRLDRYQSHPLLGPAIRGRQRLRRLVNSIAEHSQNRHTLDRFENSA